MIGIDKADWTKWTYKYATKMIESEETKALFRLS